ncbi:MAG: hypothetical protein Wins2KO_03660 [Winogradskyella sp.]
MDLKNIVKKYYETDFANTAEAINDFLHKDCKIHWHSSKGYNEYVATEIKSMFKDVYNTYESFRPEISHMLQDGNFVTTRYTLHGSTIETPDTENPIAHFITIWELKDGKLFSGHEISQLADDSEASLSSFEQKKV